MRTLLALAVILGGTLALAEPADARHSWRTRNYDHAVVKIRKYKKRCDHDCVRARSLDPAGDYKNFPDWARAALSPKLNGATRR